MKNFNYSISLLMMLITCITWAQEEYIGASSESVSGIDPQLLISKTFSDLEAKNDNLQSQNSVFIQQVGNNNFTTATVITEVGNVKLSQEGNNNVMSLVANAKSVEANIGQKGNNNRSFDFAYAPYDDIRLNLQQNGNNHHFERYGSNSIGNNLQFEMTGDFRSIIVRNYK